MNINLPTLLDVAIGLVFIFFIFSMFVSGIVELINSLLEQRAKLLRRALDKILGSLSTKFFSHPLTDVKQEVLLGFHKPINYLSADSFSTVLIDLLAREDMAVPAELTPTEVTFGKIKQVIELPNYKKIKELIRPILAKSDDFQTFKAELEKWYNGYMEQVSGWFKRYAQGVVWIVAILVSAGLNVDTIYLTNRLFNDSGLRDKLVAEAVEATHNGGQDYKKDTKFGQYLYDHVDTNLVQSISTKPKTFTILSTLTDSDKLSVQSAYIGFLHDQVDDLKLPIGWNCSSTKSKSSGPPFQAGQNHTLAILGWILTAAALSFGAPFWFDLLLKLVNIRNTARRPPGNPDPAT